MKDITKDIEWLNGLYWDVDGHTFTVTGVNQFNLSCRLTETWISEDTWENCENEDWYSVMASNDGRDLILVNKKYREYRFCASAAFNYDSLCPDEFNVYREFKEDKEEEEADSEDECEYTPSSTFGDYGPSNPWDAPGMSIRDFI